MRGTRPRRSLRSSGLLGAHAPSSSASRSASAISSMVSALRNRSSGSAGHATVEAYSGGPSVDLADILDHQCVASSWRKATLHNPITGCVCPAEAAHSSCAPCSIRACCNRATRCGQKRTIGGGAQDPRNIRAVGRPPVERGKKPASRPGKSSTASASQRTRRPRTAPDRHWR